MRWWRRYLRGKAVDDYHDWKRNYWLDFLAAIQLPLPAAGAKVLDAGCGPAGIFIALEHSDVTAVDPLLNSYQSFSHFRQNQFQHVRFVSSSLETFDANHAFDYVFCLNVINHVRDLRAVAQVLAQAVRTHGTVVVSVDAHRHRWLKPIFQVIPGDILHPHQHDLEAYIALFEKVGLQLVDKLLFKQELLFDYWVLTLKPVSHE